MRPIRSTVRLVALAATTTALFAAAACSSDDEPDETTTTAADTQESSAGLEEATIGVILPETGRLSVPATEIRQGMETAVELWNSGSDGPTITLEVCDDGGEVERSLACIDQFETAGVDVFAGPHFGTTWLAAEEDYVNREALVVTGTPAAVPPSDGTIFSSGTPASVALEMVFGELSEAGDTSVGMLVTSDGTAQAAAAAAAELAPEFDLELSTAEFDNAAETARPQAQQLVDGEPDAIVIWSSGLSAVTGLRALDEVGYEGPVIMNYSNAGASTYELAGEAVPSDLRLIGTRSMLGEVEDAERAAWIEEFIEMYEADHGTVSFNALSAGDIVAVAAAAAANGTTPAEMTEYLESGETVPGFAVEFVYSTDSHVGSNDPGQLRLVQLSDGAWIPAQE